MRRIGGPGRDVRMSPTRTYQGIGIINDPIHGYIRYTRPRPGETAATERDLMDHPWVQRMRYISQLQSARWVYPSAEHTRFQHLLGSVSVASRVAAQVTPTLQAVEPSCPSAGLVECLLRVAALLHDIGHGPFSHFFDEHYLRPLGWTHERIGAYVVEHELGDMIRTIRRTPHAELDPAESLEPAWVAHLVMKGHSDRRVPRWVSLLVPVFGGIYTADNMDYVLRDSYMTGVKIGPVDIDRLIYYSFYTRDGLTLHRAGMQALFMFLSARIYLYQNVYYHRVARAVDLQMRELFPETVRRLLPASPIKDLGRYRDLTDWSFFTAVRRWSRSRDPEKRRLSREWTAILERRLHWRSVYEVTLTLASARQLAQAVMDETELERRIRDELPPSLREVPFRVDLAAKDARPLNPIQMGPVQVSVFDPVTERVAAEPLFRLLDWLPARVVQLRVFSRQDMPGNELEKAVQRVLKGFGLPAMVS